MCKPRVITTKSCGQTFNMADIAFIGQVDPRALKYYDITLRSGQTLGLSNEYDPRDELVRLWTFLVEGDDQ